MMMAARKRLSLIGINLWQTGLRSLFRYYIVSSKQSQDEAWASVRAELETSTPLAEEWEYQEIRAILYEEHNITVEEAEAMYERYPDSTPLLDALRMVISHSKSSKTKTDDPK